MKLVVNIIRESDGRYRACCPALPGCRVIGRSKREAASRAGEAAKGYLASLNVALPHAFESRLVVRTGPARPPHARLRSAAGSRPSPRGYRPKRRLL